MQKTATFGNQLKEVLKMSNCCGRKKTKPRAQVNNKKKSTTITNPVVSEDLTARENQITAAIGSGFAA